MKLNENLEKMVAQYARMSQRKPDDFLNELVRESLENYAHLRSGGLVCTIPNPQFFALSEDDMFAIYGKLLEFEHCATIHALPLGLDQLTAFVKERFYKDDEERRNAFRKCVQADAEIADDYDFYG